MTAVPKDILLGFTRWTFMRHRTPLWRNAKTSQSWPPRPQRNHAFFGRDPIAGRSLRKFGGMDSEKLFNSNTQLKSGSGSAIGIGSFQSRPVPRPFFFFPGSSNLGKFVMGGRLLRIGSHFLLHRILPGLVHCYDFIISPQTCPSESTREIASEVSTFAQIRSRTQSCSELNSSGGSNVRCWFYGRAHCYGKN
jgi:hypothetical protein